MQPIIGINAGNTSGRSLPARQGENTMTRKDSINKMRDLLVTRRNALRKALAGDLSLLKQLREQTGGDVVDAALDAAQDEISSQLAEVESRELANIERALVRIRTAATASAKSAATGFRWPGSTPCPTPPAASNASGRPKPAAARAARRRLEPRAGHRLHRRRRFVQRPGSSVRSSGSGLTRAAVARIADNHFLPPIDFKV